LCSFRNELIVTCKSHRKNRKQQKKLNNKYAQDTEYNKLNKIPHKKNSIVYGGINNTTNNDEKMKTYTKQCTTITN